MQEKLKDKIFIGIAFTYCAVGVGMWMFQGTRKIEDVYTTSYLGKPAVVQHEDRRFEIDKYHILLNGRDSVTGEITDDNGKRISVYNNWFTSGYQVKDSEKELCCMNPKK
ncbi:MAG: hypothetical protein AABX54_05075 [Nanoarchaeota archaeon]